ncbi:MFS transporter [Aeromicrobium camelliae]|uniref:MFS transporter n=1 Tax=Aeromicrobium camelliae TaxID=1538144 RepID=A0A3N6YFC1_9ACTN|nr:MFS transporter [Aeromicrobium camelliae]RQN08504.1 MFS transporter [Aeromicrobium camelliae]
MLSTYAALLRTPGAAAFSLAATLGRLPLSMAGLGIVLLVVERTGSYAQAGVVAAGYILAAAVAAPIQGRVADRWGQAPVLVAASLIFAAGAGLILATAGGPTTVAMLCAAVAGLGAPQTGNMARRRWSHLLAADRARLSTAFALEAVLDEAVFIVGPVLVTFLTISVAEPAGLLVAAACSCAGSWGLAAHRSSAPPTHRGARGSSERLPAGLLAVVVVAAACMGVLFGSTEVLVVAFTDEQGRPGLAGLVLALWAVGSLAAGVIVGALPAPASPLGRLRATTAVLGLLFLPLPWAPNVALLAAGMLVTGFMVAPTLIAATTLVEATMPPARLTEALMWTGAGLSIGVAPGASLSGIVVDEVSASAGFLVPCVAALAASAIAVAYRRPLPVAHPTG